MRGNRIKLQVQNERGHWRTAWCLITMLHENLIHLKAYGYKVRVGGRDERF